MTTTPLTTMATATATATVTTRTTSHTATSTISPAAWAITTTRLAIPRRPARCRSSTANRSTRPATDPAGKRVVLDHEGVSAALMHDAPTEARDWLRAAPPLAIVSHPSMPLERPPR